MCCYLKTITEVVCGSGILARDCPSLLFLFLRPGIWRVHVISVVCGLDMVREEYRETVEAQERFPTIL